MEHMIPRHLAAPSRAWLRHLADAYEWTPSEWTLAVLAAETRDRASTARRQLQREGLTTSTKDGGLRPHPATIIARDCTALYSRLLGQLGLDDESEAK
jgi:phage terminase small subunit